MEKLTIEQAIEQGYTKFLYAEDGFQAPKDLSGINDDDFIRKPQLVKKELYTLPVYIDAEQLRDMIAEQCWEQHHDESGDDTDTVNDAITEMPLEIFEPVIAALKEKMATLSYYKSSGIELVQ